MKLIEPSVEILEQSSGLNGIYEQIEIAGRTCYKSEDKITETSAKDFVDRMVASKHYAMLEHGAIYLLYRTDYNSNTSSNGYDEELAREINGFIKKYESNKYSKVIHHKVGYANYIAITTNYRVLIENDWLDDLQYICEPTEYHEKRVSVKFICDRGVSHEIVRHRVFSFAQESTRYCNYSKDKFGNELTFIKPSTLDDQKTYSFIEFYNILETIEKAYLLFLEEGWKPQEARAILPNCLKTEIVMTGFESDYDHFFELRCAKTAHPDMQLLANKLKKLVDEKK